MYRNAGKRLERGFGRKMEKLVLNGGREGKIVREKDLVVRPGNIWTPYVHSFLNFLKEKGMENIPVPYGLREDGKEMVSFVEGETFHEGLPEALFNDTVLSEAADLLHQYHEAGKAYIERLSGVEIWMLPVRSPKEAMCHGDFAPYNVTFVGEHVHGIIDFDTVHPGPRLWDVAYAVYRWVPFMAPSNPESREDLAGQLRRLKLFSDRYGLSRSEKSRLPGVMIERLESLISYMRKEADNGNEDMLRNIKEGHLALYQNDILYIRENEENIRADLLSTGN